MKFNFDSNFYIIIFILFSLVLYLNLNEKFEDKQKCSDIKLTPVDSCNSQLCPSSCKMSLTKDGNSCYCVDDI